MVVKKEIEIGGVLKIVIISLLLLLIGVYPVIAEGHYYHTLDSNVWSQYDKVDSDGVSDFNFDAQGAIFSPAPNYFVVQGLVDPDASGSEMEPLQPPYCVETNLFKVEWGDGIGNDAFNDEDFKFGLMNYGIKSFSGVKTDNYKYNVLGAYLDNIHYVMGATATKCLLLNTFQIIEDKNKNWKGSWSGQKTIQYWYDQMTNTDYDHNTGLFGPDNSKYNHYINVVPNETGIYLISRQTVNNVPTLDISFLPQEDLDGTVNSITPKHLYTFKNTGDFTPVPDSQIYDVTVNGHINPDGEVLVGATDHQGSIISWYINSDGTYGQKILIDKNDMSNRFSRGVRNLVFNEGNCQGDEGGVNNISAYAFEDTTMYNDKDNAKKGNLSVYSSNVPSFENKSTNWNLVYKESGNKEQYFMGKGRLDNFILNVPIEHTPNYWTIPFFGVIDNYEGDDNCGDYTFFLSYFASNKLIFNTTPAYSDYAYYGNKGNDIFNHTGNAVVPIGFVDGVPPISFNGETENCASSSVSTEIDLTTDKTNSISQEGSVEDSASIAYGHEFLKGKVGTDIELSGQVQVAKGSETTYTKTVDTGFKKCTDYDPSEGNMIYLAPNFQTWGYNVADYNGVIPTSNAEIVYLTEWNQNDIGDVKNQMYNISTPSGDSPLFKGMMSSPINSDFDTWNWETWSGGWLNRDWGSSNPYDDTYTAYTITDNLHWAIDSEPKVSVTYSSETSKSLDYDVSLDADAAFLGISINDSLKYAHSGSLKNSINEGITLTLQGSGPKQDVCGYSTITDEAFILVPNDGKNPPWVPDVYAGYKPWLISYSLTSYDTIGPCDSSASETVSNISKSIRGKGEIILPSGGIEKNATGQVNAIPAEGYAFLHWKGYGIDLDDSSSPVTNATVHSKFTTLRAYFAKQSSSLVDSSFIAIQNNSVGNQIKIQGNLPSGFNKYVGLHHRTPVKITVGDLSFPFGLTVGNVTIVSDHEIAYTTEDPENGVSNLRVDFGTKKWWFAADQVKDLAGKGIDSNIVRIGIGGKNVTESDNVLMVGQDDIFWEGRNEMISNELFSLQNATLFGKMNYHNGNEKNNTLLLNGGYLNVSLINSTEPLTLNINGVEVEYDNSTSRNGNILTYQKSGKDLNATVTINKDTKVWNVEMDGKRLTYDYWSNGVSIRLKLGDKMVSEVIHPKHTTFLKTPNIDTSGYNDEDSLSRMNYGM